VYATFRIQKLKSVAQIEGAGAHCTRAKSTPNAAVERQALNRLLGPAPDLAIRTKLDELAKEGVRWRSDAVRAIEIVAGASPEYWGRDGLAHIGDPEAWDMAKIEKFEARVISWARKEFGDGNLVSVTRHMDESSPHWHLFVVPLDTTPSPERRRKADVPPPKRAVKRPRIAWAARLNSKRWIGSPKILGALQTRFAVELAPLGLERGRAGSRADYQDVQQFYGLVKDLGPELAQARTVAEAKEGLEKIIKNELGGMDRVRQMAALAAQQEIQNLEKSGVFNLANDRTKKKLREILGQLQKDVAGGQPSKGPSRSRSND